MPIAIILFVLAGLTAILGGIDFYQAVTGRRVSKRPSSRSEAVMRRQSGIAAAVLGAVAVLAVAVGIFVLNE